MKKIKRYLIFAVLFISILMLPIAYSRYSQVFNRKVTLNVRKPKYNIKFYSNRNDGNEDEVTLQEFVYGTKQKLTKNSYTNGIHNFKEWNTETDGSGTWYNDEQEVDKLSSTDGEEVKLYAQWTLGVAEIDGVSYSTLQSAVDAVPKDNTETTIKLLTNTSENITIETNQNIVFNLQNYTLSDPGTGAVITNKGTTKIISGTIKSSSVSDGAINNESNAKLTISGGSVFMMNSGGKQALYNKAKGIVEITGTAFFSSVSKSRATVQNIAGGILYITGGTIISSIIISSEVICSPPSSKVNQPINEYLSFVGIGKVPIFFPDSTFL